MWGGWPLSSDKITQKEGGALITQFCIPATVCIEYLRIMRSVIVLQLTLINKHKHEQTRISISSDLV